MQTYVQEKTHACFMLEKNSNKNNLELQTTIV